MFSVDFRSIRYVEASISLNAQIIQQIGSLNLELGERKCVKKKCPRIQFRAEEIPFVRAVHRNKSI